MSILVTGCAGFTGYNVCKRLLKEGNRIIGVDNLNDDYDVSIKKGRISELKIFKKFDFIKLDILNDGLPSLLRKEKIDYIIHLAAKEIYYNFKEDSNNRYSRFLETNVTGTSKIFELAHKFNVKKFVYVSAYSVYGKTRSTTLDEKVTNLKPISPHGASKLAAEEVIHFMHNLYGVPSVILRMSVVYGPNSGPSTSIPEMIDSLRRNGRVNMYSDNIVRDYIYIDDVVEYIISSLKLRGKDQTINISSGDSYSIKEVAKEIADVLGIEKEIKYVQDRKSFDRLLVKSLSISNKRAKKLFNYSPEVSLKEGLSLTVNWYLNNLDVLSKSSRGF